ncbi:FtsX-like permease family protein [Mucilaginibacter sp. UR6-11]|uniref:ABC transporter permease n=1 Tax=Mucilaginibacter sp. UR6-11 TaxID=1435644 RepID=UPI001E3710C2|nr:FtsX-like permease family protein [Mucilaginibacter sp. UR6-11]MCC8425018.1 FtsX-like permease family protein [Mucilaginibacter sp. UR6-11]
MNTSIYIAKRYLVSSKKMHAINIISGISMMGILIGTAALIILLSVFNGLEKVIVSLNSNFAPELRIAARLGKTFNPNTAYFKSIHHDSRLFSYTEVLEDKVVIQYGDKTFIGRIKGVSEEFLKNTRLDSTILDGSFTLQSNNSPMAVLGVIVHNNLGININSLKPLQIYSPKRDNAISINPEDEFTARSIYPSGVFSIQQESDDFVIVPIEFTRDLFNQPAEVSSIDLNYKKGTDLASVETELQQKLGEGYTVKNRREQDTTLYKTLNYERWAVFMILAFVVIIAAFNIVGSLTILVIDKRKDIAILTSLGGNRRLIQGIFFFEGLMISLIGCFIGIVLGFIFCILQQRYGMIQVDGKINVPNNAYPIDIKLTDFGLVFFTVLVISVIASGISARLSIKGLDDIKQDL